MSLNLWYKLMVLEYKLRDRKSKPGEIVERFGLQPGFTAVDYGCGPGRYLETASYLVGDGGLVYAADISEVGILYAKKRIGELGLKNVIPVILEENRNVIPDHCADVVYALDMFHLVDDPVSFLANIHRIIKKGCLFYLEDGHQTRTSSLKKVEKSDLWVVKENNKDYVVLKAL